MGSQDKLVDIEAPPIIERALLARLVLPEESESEIQESLDEMERLASTAGANVICTVKQNRQKPCPGTLIGKGKADQIRHICDEQDIGLVIFDSDLTPAQGANLEDHIGQKVVDRTQLILDIFAQRARTSEGKHQVELAQLKYMLPRLTGRGSVMRQQGGIGVRGPGEQKLEIDRRVIRRRIARLEEELETIRKQRQTQRKRRSSTGLQTVALVGYTNAGKSSLLNALTGSDAFVEDKLFATLDPTTRRLTLPSGRPVAFSDTVGFVRKLPHSLVAAFRATLEEVTEADLILIVADASQAAVRDHLRAVYAVLDEIGAADKPMLTAFNKIDIADADNLSFLTRKSERALFISAHTGTGLRQLLEEVDTVLSANSCHRRFRIPQNEAGIVDYLHTNSRVVNQHYEGNNIIIDAEVDPDVARQYQDYIETTGDTE